MKEVILFSTPWPLFNRPSLQLGALKAYLCEHVPDVAVRTCHAYLPVAASIGYDLYRKISERTWISEAPYAALLYPDRMETVESLWERTGRRGPDRITTLPELCAALAEESARILDGIEWSRVLLAGASICFGQLTSSLYFIREIKKRAPQVQSVVGGSGCAGEMGRSLLDSFPEIEFVVSGEGERPLASLIRHLLEAGSSSEAPSLPGVFSRADATVSQDNSQVANLDILPIPDFEDYFLKLGELDSRKRFVPKIPVEISRGCWWKRRASGTGERGCAFCNLNLQWRGYRAKSVEHTIREVDVFSERHQTLSFSFMDNTLPFRGLEELFGGLRGLGKDLRLFAEIRARTRPADLAAMGRAGMREVQVGIEALSTELLKKLNKGATAMDNVEVMKHCEMPGFPDLTGNLILEFPSSQDEEVAETLRTLAFVEPFRPLKGISFWLGFGSPVWRAPRHYGIGRIGNHRLYGHLFPAEVLRGLKLMIQGYRGEIRRQRRLWKPVRDALMSWREAYDSLHARPGSEPILSFQEGGDFIIIRQRRYGGADMSHRLTGTSRKIYLFCQRQRSIRDVLSKFPGLGEDRLAAFVRTMEEKKLMYTEGERCLSLAVPAGVSSLRASVSRLE